MYLRCNTAQECRPSLLRDRLHTNHLVRLVTFAACLLSWPDLGDPTGELSALFHSVVRLTFP